MKLVQEQFFNEIKYSMLNLRLFNAEYYPNLYRNDLAEHNSQLVQWCEELMGPGGVWYDGFKRDRWIVNSGSIWFRDQEDLFCFIMRWS